MGKEQKKILNKLKSLARNAERFTTELNELINLLETEESTKNKAVQNKTKRSSSTINWEEISLDSLKKKSRDEALELLNGATQKELSHIFRELGGTSRDAKKRKGFLIERIQWQLFDFEEGHSILKQTKNRTA